MEILNDKTARDQLRKRNIKITADLTPRQRDEVLYYRQQGLTAYFVGGKLTVDHRRTGPSYQHQNNARADDWDHRPRQHHSHHSDTYRRDRQHPT